MTNNNVSRAICAKVMTKMGFPRVKKSKNVFETEFETVAFSITSKSGVDCRQFYDECEAVICFSIKDDALYYVGRESINITGITRRTPDGEIAYNASLSYDAIHAVTNRRGNDIYKITKEPSATEYADLRRIFNLVQQHITK